MLSGVGKYFTPCRATDFKTALNTPNNGDLLWNLIMSPSTWRRYCADE
jgi:hypothetical protein